MGEVTMAETMRGVLVWKAPTETMNAKVDKAIISEACESDPESARAEYGAEFRDDLADFCHP
jgi:hypothetical protein